VKFRPPAFKIFLYYGIFFGFPFFISFFIPPFDGFLKIFFLFLFVFLFLYFLVISPFLRIKEKISLLLKGDKEVLYILRFSTLGLSAVSLNLSYKWFLFSLFLFLISLVVLFTE
jgi:hypothetical protein